jgi:transcriptional regulator CtsR
MAKLSDIIEEFIKVMISEAKENELEIQRNELANQFSCAPSQINYVLTTRFTTEKGYFIESKRGGGGCIRIRKIEYLEKHSLADIILEKIGSSVTYNYASQIIDTLYDSEIITERETKIFKMAINDRSLSLVCDNRNKLRADILKAMILAIII